MRFLQKERDFKQLAKSVGVKIAADYPPEVQARLSRHKCRTMAWMIGGAVGATAALLLFKFGSNLYVDGQLRPSLPKSVAVFCKGKAAPESIMNFSALRSPAAVRAAIPEGCEAQMCEQNQGVLNCKSAANEEVAQLANEQAAKDERSRHIGFGIFAVLLTVCGIGILRSWLKERRCLREVREWAARNPQESAATPPA